MKKIIKNNKKDFGVQGFTCEHCSSVFETDEYEMEKDDLLGKYSVWYGYQLTPHHTLIPECPVCGRRTRKHIPTGEDPYWSGHAI